MQSALCTCLQAWAEDPLEALRLVAQLRDIRNGKGVTTAGQECLTWLQERHPLTLAANLEEVVRVSGSCHRTCCRQQHRWCSSVLQL